MKALVGAFNQEKALVGAFSVILQPVVEPMEHYTALLQVAATNTATSDTAADRDTPPPPAAVSFQFGVFNNNLKHFTMGKLEKVRKCFLGALTILYNGFYF